MGKSLTTPTGAARARPGRANAKMGECGGHFWASAMRKCMTPPTVAVRARRGRANAKMGECGGHFWAPAVK
jgi:hypothetical protein